MEIEKVVKSFCRVGRDLYSLGMVTSHGGNMSLFMEDQIIITRRGAMLGHITRHDLVLVGIEPAQEQDSGASSELPSHRRIYQVTGAKAVLHAHPAHAIALSLITAEIVPIDIEGAYILGRVPVISTPYQPDSVRMTGLIADALKINRVVMFRGHGAFSTGESLEDALHYMTALEASAQIIALRKAMGPGFPPDLGIQKKG